MAKTKNNVIAQILKHDPDLLKAERARRSMFAFVQEFWDVIISDPPVYNWHIKYICEELEKVAWNIIANKTREYDLIVNVPPGSTKTTLITVMFPAWLWIARPPKGFCEKTERRFAKKAKDGEDPRPHGMGKRFITASYAETVSLDASSKSRDIVQSDKYRRFFPEMVLRRDENTKTKFTNTHMGYRYTSSVGSAIIGMHGHCLIIDDPINPEQAESDASRYTANEWLGNLPTRAADKRTTPIILVMQRLHESDPTAELKRIRKRVRHIRLPGELADFEVSPPELRKLYVDGLLDPVRIPQDEVDGFKHNPYRYAGQIGQDPRPREGGMFTKDMFEIVDSAPPGGRDVRGWDLAATKKKSPKDTGQAATTGQKLRIVGGEISDNGVLVGGTVYVMDEVHGYWDGDTVRKEMRRAAERDGKYCIQDLPQDPGQAGKAQVQTLVAELAGYTAKFSPESGNKVLRAEPFATQAQAGNVKLVRGPWNAAWIDEVTMFPNGRKDRVDACSRAYMQAIDLHSVMPVLPSGIELAPPEDEGIEYGGYGNRPGSDGEGFGVFSIEESIFGNR